MSYKFNNLDPNTASVEKHAEAQHALLSEFLGNVGSGTFIEPPFRADYGSNISIGKNCFMNFKYVLSNAMIFRILPL